MPKVLCIIGWSGSGKTTLLTRLLRGLSAAGVRVAALKHTPHPHPLHKPGSDSEAFAGAGARVVGLQTDAGIQWSWHMTLELTPAFLEAIWPSFGADLLLIEGMKDGPFPKIEALRDGLGPPLWRDRQDVIAVVTDLPGAAVSGGPRVLRLDDISEAVKFVIDFAAG